jgi:8-oxo-dGTP pyrophosphatase MutT (NUDIX family)
MAGDRSGGTERLYRGLVSIKGIAWHDGRVVLVKNHRGEWELPGGKLLVGEQFADCLRREFAEELGLAVEPGPLVTAAPHHVYPDIIVLVYGCTPVPGTALRLSHEHTEAGWFARGDMDQLPIPLTYRRAVQAWQPGCLVPDLGL